MMWEYPTYGESCTIGITLNSPSNAEFGLRITDMDNDTVVYTDRTGKFKGEETYYVPLPIDTDNALNLVCPSATALNKATLSAQHVRP